MFTIILSFVLLTGEVVPIATRKDSFPTMTVCEKVRAEDEAAFRRDLDKIKAAEPAVKDVKLECVKK